MYNTHSVYLFVYIGVFMKKNLSLKTLLGCVLGVAFFCETVHATTVGVSMPNLTTPRWQVEGNFLKSQLEEAGYNVSLAIADNDPKTQINDIQKMIDSGCEYLVISAIDGKSLTKVLDKAKAKNIAVIAYDRIILDTDAVSYYATYDNYSVGTMQGKFLVDALHLDESSTEPKNIEIFSGSNTDANARFVYEGNMAVLRTYLDKGKLIIKSGEKDLEITATPNWLGSEAQKRLVSLFESFHYGHEAGKEHLDAILSASDGISTGLIETLTKQYGYNKGNIPIITGQDCSKPAAKNVRKGLQSMCIFKDSRVLAYQVTEMINAIVNKTEVPVNDNSTYNNGVKVVPTYLCSPVIVTKDNLKEVLIESEFYQPKDLR